MDLNQLKGFVWIMTNKLFLIIKTDENDADYKTDIHEITQEQLDKLFPVFEAIKNFKPYTTISDSEFAISHTHNSNWPNGDGEFVPRFDLGEKSIEEIYDGILTGDQIDEFNDLIPFNIHTVVSIQVIESTKETEYYQHKYN